MGDMKWTDSQRDAITAKDGSVLVSAAAGSGKTAVLVQRVIETITAKENNISIDRMLIVTFTRAAREEMLTRVEKAITELLKNDPYNKHLLKQRQLLPSAKIDTIDGFCTDFVRQYFYKLDIPQDFKIADEKDLVVIKNKAMDNVLENLYNENSQEFLNLIDAVCTYKSDDRLRNNIFKLYNFLVTIPFMDSWMDNALALYNNNLTPINNSPFVKAVLDNLSSCIDYCSQLSQSAINQAENDEVLEAKERTKLLDVLNQDNAFINNLKEVILKGNWNDIIDENKHFKWRNFPGIKGEIESVKIIKSIRNNYKKEIQSAFSLLFADIETIKSETEKLEPLIKMFFNCVKSFHKEFTRLKNEKKILDFPDIENNMIKLLCKESDNGVVNTEIAKEISSMFDCIMVDEFQDINEVQNLIFKSISKDESNLFMVGDVKQSIYGFRQANPEIFTSYKEKYTLFDRDNPTYPAKIILDKNFRSRESVLNACNYVFSKLMSNKVGGIVYNEEEVLNCGSNAYLPTDNTETEVILVNTSKSSDDNDDTKTIIEARAVARKIHKIINEEKYMVQDKDGLRPVRFGDFAILLRSSKGMGRKASIYVDTLNMYGLVAVASEKKSIFDSYEIKILLNFLKIIDNPTQDIPLLSVLMCPVFAFNADDLTEIRGRNKKGSLYTALLNAKEQNAKVENFLEILSYFRKLSVTTAVDKLIGIILEVTGFDGIVMASNKEPAKNIMLLQKYAVEYGEYGYGTLSSFLSFIDNIIEKGLFLDGSVSTNSENLEAIKVMSIHSSKGLEFPVCFICDTNTQFNLRDTTEDMVIDAKIGIGIRYKEDYVKYDTLQRKAVSLLKKNSSISEELRILYVAMTRAKERLIITAGNREPEKYITFIADKLTGSNINPYVVSNFKSLSDWIVVCGLLHPCGEEWRKIAGRSYKTDEENLFPWKFYIDSNEEEITTEKPVTEAIIEKEADEKFLQQFFNKKEFKYKYENVTTLPEKVSVSALTHKDRDSFEKSLNKPNFMKETSVSGLDIGTAFHNFMEHCNLISARENFSKEMQRLKETGFITENQFNMIDVDKTLDFLNSPLITRVINSEKYFREYLFTVKISSKEYDPEIPKDLENEKVILQGAVDLLFIENGEIVIVDYKTDRVKDVNYLKELYSKQLYLYKIAIEQCFELPVKEMYIYSLHLNEKIALN